MLPALLALPFTVQLLAPVTLDISAQSQFTRPSQAAETMRFRDMDRNNDGVVTRSEWRGSDQSFRVHDWNGDGILSGDEVRPNAVRPGTRDENTGIYDDREDTFENLDANRNNQVERSEWHGSDDAFRWLDRNNDGVLNRREVVGRPGNRTAVDRGQNPRDPRAASVGTPGQNCESNAARIVDDIYQQVLERPADQHSAGFTEALTSGRTTVRDIVAQLAKSDEHASRYFWTPVTTTVYRKILKREPSQQELQQATAELASGRTQIIDIIARSARRAANSDEEAVKILYRQLLGREADPEGLRGFTEQASRQGIESVARDLAASAEYRQRSGASALDIDNAAYESAVRTLYRHVLGREADAAAVRSFTRIAATRGFDAVVGEIVSGRDYESLYGNDVVPGRGARYCGPTP
jgi:hypothetical protein